MCGLTCTLETYHHDNSRGIGCDLKLLVGGAHKSRQLLVYYFDDLLTGIERFKHLRADCSLGNGLYKITDDLKVNVCLKECKLYLAHTRLDVRLGKSTLVLEFFEGIFKLFA